MDGARRRWLAWAEYGVGDFAAASDQARRALDRLPPQTDRAADPSVVELRLDLQYVLGLAEIARGDVVEAGRWLGDGRALGVLVDTRPDGLLVQRVFRALPGERAGLRAGDLITACDGVAVGAGWPDLTDVLQARPVGADVALSLRRDGADFVTVATLGLAPPPPPPRLDVAGDDRSAESGVALHSIAVEPVIVTSGSPFRIVAELTARSVHGAGAVPVDVSLRILREGREVTRNEWTEQLRAGELQRLVKEVPHAAGSPGRYTVTLSLESPAGADSRSAAFDIVAAP